MSEAQQGPQERWTRYNHRFEEWRTKGGYAVCTLCDTHENEDGINRICRKGPIATSRLYSMAELAAKIDKRIEGYVRIVPEGAAREAAVDDLQECWTEFKTKQGMETDALEAVLRSRNMIQCSNGHQIEVVAPADHPVLLMVKCGECGEQVSTHAAVVQGLELQIKELRAQLTR